MRNADGQRLGLRAGAAVLALGASAVVSAPACRAVEGLSGLTFDLTDGGGGAVTVGTGVTGAGGGPGGAGGSGGSGGRGGGPQCSNAAGCNDANPCTIDACLGGRCVHEAAPDGPAPGVKQAIGTCQEEVCSAGVDVMVPDDKNLPPSNNPCVTSSCAAGEVVHTDAALGMSCGTLGKCNATGQCVGCNTPSDCGKDTFCQTQTCTGGMCGTLPTAAGTVLPAADQTAGNCQSMQCDGLGSAKSVADDANLPTPATCTMAVCTAGVPSTPPVPAGMPGPGCATQVCNGSGACVQCVDDAQCKAPDGVCGAQLANVCGCTADPTAVTCSGKCGMVVNNCEKFVACGNACVAPQSCGGGGTPNVCGCMSKPMALICLGLCGIVDDNCNLPVDCGTAQCVAPDECGGGGTPNVCGCTPDAGMGC